MASGYKNAAGTDFDDLFDPDVVGDGPTASGFMKADGTLLKYAAAKYGTVGPNVNFKLASGADVATLWAKKGSASYALPINGDNFVAHSDGTISSAMDANIAVQIKSDGTYLVTCVGNGSVTPGASGTWLPSGQSVSDYQVEFVWSQSSQFPTGPATVTNGAATYQACTSTRTISFDAQVGQLTGNDKGSIGNLAINLKRVSTGVVNATNVGINVESFGSG